LLLPVTQSYSLRHKVTSSCVLISVDGSNFVPQEATWEDSPCMIKVTSSYVLLSVERINFVSQEVT
jgi:hypothetical protein